MSIWRLVGVALLIVGLGMMYFGWQASESLAEQTREMVTGSFSDQTTWQLIGGAAAAIVGLLLALFGGKTR
ncbi:MAG: DUF3185 family protein [Wenzhouxiangellaceae bacterium]|nr:MAG: DUF3185 family protein [Wenzhouxiangellaceae bacterium]